MSDIAPPSTLNTAEAAAWWRARLDGEDAGEADWLGYEAWLAASPKNRAAADAVDAALIIVEDNRAALAQQPEQTTSRALPDGDAFTRRVWSKPALWTTGALAIAAAALLFVITTEPRATHLAYEAPAQSDRIVALPDGSSVHLNRGASVTIDYGRERRVTLASGEASFSVIHDPAHAFVVTAGDSVIRDIGTEFNVAINPTSTVVTVRSGEVALTAAQARESHVGAGMQARVEAGQIRVGAASSGDAFAWQSGRLVYHAAPLATVIEDIGRYSDTPIVLDAAAANALQFSGVLVIDDPQRMLARLEAFLPIRATQEGDRIVVRRQS